MFKEKLPITFSTAISTVYIKAVLLPRFTCKVLEQPLFQYYKILLKHVFLAVLYFSISYWVFLKVMVSGYVELALFSCLVCLIYALISLFAFSRPLQQQLLKLLPKKYKDIIGIN